MAVPFHLLAAGLISGSDIGFNGPSTADTAVSGLLGFAYFVLGIVAVALIVYSGYMYTTSNGDPGKIKKAKDSLLYAVIGVVVALLAFVITNFVITGAGK